MIQRPEYLEKLKKFKDKELIKVVTGIRRCGKSTLLEMYKKLKLTEEQKQIANLVLKEINERL